MLFEGKRREKWVLVRRGKRTRRGPFRDEEGNFLGEGKRKELKETVGRMK